jgi:5-methyltetrahydrofolate corrinoid/iron sulfur protein methyltransferase
LPTSADARIELASEKLLPAAMENGVPTDRIFLDPLVLTVNGNQDQAIPTVETIRFFKQMADPPCKTTCGLSNVSNSCPNELRSLLNRVFVVMMMGAGLDSAIADPLDDKLMEVIHIVEKRNTSTPKGKLLVKLYDTCAAGGQFDETGVNMKDPELSDIVKTIRIFENKTLYAHGYLRL